ncbi:MAG: rubredoxin [bacterium]|nr:rubredoxin [bacterium]
MAKYECTDCGYVYDPADTNNIAFEKLPEDWVCPVCGIDKEGFEIFR